MNLFLANIDENTAILSESESHHAVKVLRKKEGETIYVTSGKGILAEGIITDLHPKKTRVNISKFLEDTQKRNYKLHVAFAPTKNIDRTEFFLEKATEIGIDTFTPIIAENSERRKFNPERLEKIIQSAAKQSFKSEIPTLNPLTKFSDFIKNSNDDSLKFIAHCHKDLERNTFSPSLIKDSNDYTLLIGPEGDFSLAEANLATLSNYLPISLGSQRLRTETAAISVVQNVFAFKNLV